MAKANRAVELIAGAAAGFALYELVSRGLPASEHQVGPVTVSILSAPHGQIAPSSGAAQLALRLRLINTSGTMVAATISPLIVAAVPGGTGGKWSLQGEYASQVHIDPHSSIEQTWTARWWHSGEYRTQVVVTVAGQSKSFSGPTFSISVVQPAGANVTFSGGWSGAVTLVAGQTVRAPTLMTTLKNTGGVKATYTIRVNITGGASGLRWYVYTSSGTVPAGVTASTDKSYATVTLAGGQSVTIPWSTNWTVTSSSSGSYTDVAVVSW